MLKVGILAALYTLNLAPEYELIWYAVTMSLMYSNSDLYLQ